MAMPSGRSSAASRLKSAALRPLANIHTIWEIVGHMAFWEDVAAKRLAGARAGMMEEGELSRRAGS